MIRKTPGMRSLLYSGDLLAVDLGTFAVKVLSLKTAERSLTVLGFARREVWRELAEAKTEEEKAEVYARTVRAIMAEHAFKPRNASISLSGNTVITRFASVAPGYVYEPPEGLPPEARALIPFEDHEAAVSAMLIDPPRKGAKPEMIVTVANKKTVQSGMDIVRKAGLRPAVIVNDLIALANAYEFFEGKKADELVVLVGVGASTTGVGVLERGVLKAARALNIAGGAFTRAVKREFDVTLEEAEKLKLEHGLAAADAKLDETNPVATRVARALRPTAKDLAAEIQRTIDVFLERRPADQPPVKRVLLAGGGAELRGLADRLAADTGLVVEVFRPMVNTAAADGTTGIAPLAPVLAGPCGLGLSNTLLRRSTGQRINLVPRKPRRSAIIRDVSPDFWKLIVGPVIAAVVIASYATWAVKVSRREQAMEAALEQAARREAELKLKLEKKKAPVVVKREVDPYAHLARLTISGVFGGQGGAMVMLNGSGGPFVARGGRLYDSNEEVVRGVASQIRDNALALTAGGKTYRIALPK